MPSKNTKLASALQAWETRRSDQVVGRGYPMGDFLEAHRWKLLEESPGRLRIRAHVPDHLKDASGQLSSAFVGTYVDVVAMFTVRAGEPRRFTSWLSTVTMRLDHFEPLSGPELWVDSLVLKRQGRTAVIETRFYGQPESLAVIALTTIREIPFSDTKADDARPSSARIEEGD